MGRKKTVHQRLARERSEILAQLEAWLEVHMLVLSFVWLALLVLELIQGLNTFLSSLGTAIWLVFVLDFLVKFSLAPNKFPYLRRNWLTLVSLALPALRVFRIIRMVRVLRATSAVRGLRFVRVITSLNRGMKALGKTMQRRGLLYVVTLTTLVAVGGAAGMYAFERNQGLDSYSDALWWTAMLLTSLGSDYWPQTAEGRLLCVILALYGFAVFGYVTATLATFFIGQDAEMNRDKPASPLSYRAPEDSSPSATLQSLQRDISLLRQEIQKLQKLE